METSRSTVLGQVLIMIVFSILISWFTMTAILTSASTSGYKTNNLNKVYQALLMGLLMGALELGMVLTMDSKMGNVMGAHMSPEDRDVYLKLLVVLLVGSGVLFIIIRKQIGVGQRQFLSSMIEHHGMAIAMAEKVKPKVRNDQLCGIVKNILSSQQGEIDEMRGLIKTYDQGNFTNTPSC